MERRPQALDLTECPIWEVYEGPPHIPAHSSVYRVILYRRDRSESSSFRVNLA